MESSGTKLIGKLYINRRMKTVNSGNNAHHSEIESKVYFRVTYQRDNGFAVSTGMYLDVYVLEFMIDFFCV